MSRKDFGQTSWVKVFAMYPNEVESTKSGNILLVRPKKQSDASAAAQRFLKKSSLFLVFYTICAYRFHKR
ncbi:hypothetical protein [uncultured Helicobacter sp.]|uniref:hypothetical protein n=1 Tax=uncultured Helicobacter sp. TaxID=175537 RepID=UPI00374FBA7A